MLELGRMDQSLTTDLHRLFLQNSLRFCWEMMWVLWFAEFGLYLLKCSFLLQLRYSKCKSLHLNEREKCYGRKMYTFNAHEMVKNCIWNVSLYGSETWTIVKNEEMVVNAFETWCWRRMLKIKWTARIANDKGFRRAKEEITFTHIKK